MRKAVKNLSTGGFQHGQRRVLPFMLLCICLGVWGYVLYQVIQRFPQIKAEMAMEAMVVSKAAPTSSGRSESVPEPYDAAFRDPFALLPEVFPPNVAKPPNRRRLATASSEAPPVPPSLLLNGIVGNTALLQSPKGEVHIVRAGERIEDTRVLTVQRDHVVVHFQGRSHTLHLMP